MLRASAMMMMKFKAPRDTLPAKSATSDCNSKNMLPYLSGSSFFFIVLGDSTFGKHPEENDYDNMQNDVLSTKAGITQLIRAYK
jgi:hypothetical protein